ncbi:MAG: ABC transporter ATP-binding protein [Chloroflexi bacterium]|nr:ABC transporter ATP-binding protein [Chloroflexota bacterium]
MSEVLVTEKLSRRYGRRWALQDVDLKLPTGRIIGLVGPNGAGKTTLMKLAVGLLAPTSGQIEIFGASPWKQPLQVIRRVGYVAQERPLYASFTVRDMLTFGKKLNQVWDENLAVNRLDQLGIPLNLRTNQLSNGQQAQVALVLALAKKPDLLILDEPIGSLDPLARKEFLQVLLDEAATFGQTVLLSSHQISDLEKFCDYLIILSSSRLLVSEDIDQLTATHHWLTCRNEDADRASRSGKVLEIHRNERTCRLLVKADRPIDEAGWQIDNASLEDIVLGYLALRPESTKQEMTV